MRASIAFPAFPTLHASRSWARANKNTTVAASNHWPMTTAPVMARVIRTFISSLKCLKDIKTFGIIYHTEKIIEIIYKIIEIRGKT